jgi:MFS family permease
MRNEKRIKYSTFFSSLAGSLFSPFLTLYALYLGASNFQIGLISSLTSIFAIIAQLLGTPIIESTRKKILLYIIFNSIGYLFFIPISLINNSIHLLFLISLQTFFFSFPLQVWNETLVKIFPKWRRGREIGLINKIGSLGSLIAYITAGYIIRKFGFIPYLFYAATFFGLLSGIVLIGMKEGISRNKEIFSSLKETFSFNILREKNFKNLILIIFIFNFSVSIGAPMFSVYLIKNLKADSLQLSLVSIISLIVTLVFSEAWGFVIDFVGRKKAILASLPLISFYPLFYVFSAKMSEIYFFTIIGQMGWVAFNLAIFSYLSDISEDSVSRKFMFFNVFSSIASSLGSFISGLLAEKIGVISVLKISFLMRLFSSFFFFKLGEEKGYIPRGFFSFLSPYTISSYIESFVSVYSLVLKETRKTVIDRIAKKLEEMLMK